MASKSTAAKRGESAAARAQAKTASKPVAVPGTSQSRSQTPGQASSPTSDDAKFDRLVYERVRLGIMSALTVNERLTFNELKSLFDVSDGNLSAHARKLEEAGYIECSKSFEGRRPKSEYRITATGRKALHRYLEHIEAVIKATRRV